MKKISISIIAALVSVSAFASTNTDYRDTTLITQPVESREMAYDAGLDLVDQVYQMSDSELSFKLGTAPRYVGNTIELDSSRVSVEEFSDGQGPVKYRGIVNLDYHYKVRESSSD